MRLFKLLRESTVPTVPPEMPPPDWDKWWREIADDLRVRSTDTMLVYADWLEENGHEAGWIRGQALHMRWDYSYGAWDEYANLETFHRHSRHDGPATWAQIAQVISGAGEWNEPFLDPADGDFNGCSVPHEVDFWPPKVQRPDGDCAITEVIHLIKTPRWLAMMLARAMGYGSSYSNYTGGTWR